MTGNTESYAESAEGAVGSSVAAASTVEAVTISLYVDGAIADVRGRKEALTAEQVAALRGGGPGSPSPSARLLVP
ncbi:hypothetical protein ACFC6L_02940 [Kitasatospora phosalacinea]|uniref:hypothetical protein n=1 Tax=Kitasatospora phosalacinea TaxID=2065 RepID=UPI0035DD0240